MGLFKLLYKLSQNKIVKLIEIKFKCYYINKVFQNLFRILIENSGWNKKIIKNSKDKLN